MRRWGGANYTYNAANQLTNVTDVTLNRSFFGRIFNFGDIQISSAGSAGSEISAVGLAGAEELRSAVFDLRDGRQDEVKL